MKIVIASDKWGGSLTSAAAGAALAAGARQVLPMAELVVIPVADGGDGTLDVALGVVRGRRESLVVTGPQGDPVEAPFGILDDGRVLIESAKAIGLSRVPPERRDPLTASSRGLGEMLRAVAAAGGRRVILALGGSATVDGGCGMARALGYRFRDRSGAELEEGGGALADLDRIDRSSVESGVVALEVEAWCDVASVLLGERGAARVYGPQKGADPAAVSRLESGLRRLAAVLEADLGVQVAQQPGSGAAGGLGAGAAAFLGARLASGAGRVLDLVGLDARIAGADLVITGEGRYDADAMPGKLPDAVLARAAAAGVPAAVVCADRGTEAGAAATGGPRVVSRADLPHPPAGDLSPEDLAQLASLLVRRHGPA